MPNGNSKERLFVDSFGSRRAYCPARRRNEADERIGSVQTNDRCGLESAFRFDPEHPTSLHLRENPTRRCAERLHVRRGGPGDGRGAQCPDARIERAVHSPSSLPPKSLGKHGAEVTARRAPQSSPNLRAWPFFAWHRGHFGRASSEPGPGSLVSHVPRGRPAPPQLLLHLAVDDPKAARKLAPQPVTERRWHRHRVRVAVAHEPLPGIPLEVPEPVSQLAFDRLDARQAHRIERA